MIKTKDVLIPDIGEFDQVEVIEVLVKSGDTVSAEDPLLTMESDKASMDVPSPFGGIVKTVKIKALIFTVFTIPPNGEGTSIDALSLSIVSRGSSAETVSPDLTRTSITST